MKAAARRNSIFLALLTTLCLLLVSCLDGERLISRYKDITTPGGWYEKDTIYLQPDTISLSGTYHCNLSIRVSSLYPYRNFSVRAQVKVYTKAGGEQGRDSLTAIRRELHYDIAPRQYSHIAFDGKKGYGMAYHEYDTPLGELQLNRGDSVVVAVKQNMRRETIPGIASVGVVLER